MNEVNENSFLLPDSQETCLGFDGEVLTTTHFSDGTVVTTAPNPDNDENFLLIESYAGSEEDVPQIPGQDGRYPFTDRVFTSAIVALLERMLLGKDQ